MTSIGNGRANAALLIYGIAHEARHASVVFPFESCGCSHDRVFHAAGVGGCDRPGCGCRGFHLLNQRIA